MKIFDFATKIMSMNDEVWLRHANPWSVWTRIPFIFILVPVAYSWKWLGWYILIPLSIACLWIYLNPRIFPPVKEINSWGSKAVMGEKIFTERKTKGYELPNHHIKMSNILTTASALFFIPAIAGIVILNPWMTAIGTLASWLCKMWFIDRMVWIYNDHRELLEFTTPSKS